MRFIRGALIVAAALPVLISGMARPASSAHTDSTGEVPEQVRSALSKCLVVGTPTQPGLGPIIFAAAAIQYDNDYYTKALKPVSGTYLVLPRTGLYLATAQLLVGSQSLRATYIQLKVIDGMQLVASNLIPNLPTQDMFVNAAAIFEGMKGDQISLIYDSDDNYLTANYLQLALLDLGGLPTFKMMRNLNG